MTQKTLAPLSRLAAVCALALFAAAPAAAAPIAYGDFSDIPPGNVMYLDVREDANSAGDVAPLFGAPEAIVNELDFDPSGFGSSASNGDLDVTDGQLNFDFKTTLGTGISSFTISESGDYKFFGGGALTTVNFDLIGEVMITEVNGTPLPPAGIVVPFSANGSFSSTGTIPSTAWSLSTLVELGSSIPASFGPGAVATAGEVFLNNTLVATSELGSLAFIAKKDFTIDPEVNPDPDNTIPEPTAALLAVLALAGVAARRS